MAPAIYLPVRLAGFFGPVSLRLKNAAPGNWARGLGPSNGGWSLIMLNDRETILSVLREKPLKVHEIMKRANISTEEACQSLLLKLRDDGLVKFDIHKGRWLIQP
jgi:hypothetical protein